MVFAATSMHILSTDLKLAITPRILIKVVLLLTGFQCVCLILVSQSILSWRNAHCFAFKICPAAFVVRDLPVASLVRVNSPTLHYQRHPVHLSTVPTKRSVTRTM
jgi:hypothetical protein